MKDKSDNCDLSSKVKKSVTYIMPGEGLVKYNNFWNQIRGEGQMGLTRHD